MPSPTAGTSTKPIRRWPACGAVRDHGQPGEVVTDRAAALAKAIDGLTPESLHTTIQYANNRVEADHGGLKARLRPTRGLKRNRTANLVIKGYAFIQNLRRSRYDIVNETAAQRRLTRAFDELLAAIR